MFRMRQKKLYSSAIVPTNLYVPRDADRKLKEVVLRMSKPAYISVARQMGKTNLLIQTKRSLENDVNRCVYIDITNKFESAQECFRYIVNQILNSNDSLTQFQDAALAINNARKVAGKIPTEEFQNEIREILKHFKGNLIIFLDEVDDLRKHEFSDDIFGQIRKTYFINETYPDLKRITYVLCGVIDPEKLIKTKENSPFNIAVPIYLNDFNYGEFLEFVNRSELILTNEVKEHIYNWLRGNPRMTFEILSLIEDKCLSDEIVSPGVVDTLINEFYLTSFKNPPIDHIRDLIKHNTEVRKGLIKLREGKIDEISDDLINKLYLFGIISTKSDKAELTIKNPVIEQSLSNEWLENIEIEKRGYYDFGVDKIQQGYYEDGIKLLIEYLQNEPKGNFSHFARYRIGETYNKLQKYELSNEYLMDRPINKSVSVDFYFYQIFYLGINHYKLSRFDEASDFFNEIINDSPIPLLVIQAYMNKGEILFHSNEKTSELEFLYTAAQEFLEISKGKIDNTDPFLAIINYRLGYMYNQAEAHKVALTKFEAAYKHALPSERVIIGLFMYRCLPFGSDMGAKLLIDLCVLIKAQKIAFKENSTEIITPFNEFQLLLLSNHLAVIGLWQEFDELVSHSVSFLYHGNVSEAELIFKIAEFGKEVNLEKIEALYTRLLAYPDLDELMEMSAHLVVGSNQYNKNKTSTSLQHLERYLQIFKNRNNFGRLATTWDFNAFITLISHYIRTQKQEDVQRVWAIIEPYLSHELSAENSANRVILLYMMMDFHSLMGNSRNVNAFGMQVLDRIKQLRPNLSTLSYADRQGMEQIEKETLKTLKRQSQIRPLQPIRIEREPGRNEYVKVRYKSGQEIVIKYKKAIEDIKSGECVIIKD